MNAIDICNKASAEWSHLNFKLSANSNAERAIMNSEIKAEEYFRGSCLVEVVAYASGTIHVFMTFDKVQRNLQVYDLINELNEKTSWIKGYLRKVGNNDYYFEVHYSYFDAKDEEEAAGHAIHALNDMLSDGVVEKVAAICRHSF